MTAPETAGQAAYEAWHAKLAEHHPMAHPPYPWDLHSDEVHAEWEAAATAAIAAAAPAQLATVDLHRWYAVIEQPNGMTKVIGHTSDGLGYYDSVAEWEAKNS